MATSNLEIYETLKPHVGEEGARMIAEVLPSGAEMATKDDVRATESKLSGEIANLREYIDRRFAELESRFFRLILVFFVPLWVTILGSVLAIALRL